MKFEIYIIKPDEKIQFASIKLADDESYDRKLNYVQSIVQVLYQEHQINELDYLKIFDNERDKMQIEDEDGIKHLFNHHKNTWTSIGEN